MMLFVSPIGPLVLRYENGALVLKDLNLDMQWPMRRGELLRLGARCIYAAITEGRPSA